MATSEIQHLNLNAAFFLSKFLQIPHLGISLSGLRTQALVLPGPFLSQLLIKHYFFLFLPIYLPSIYPSIHPLLQVPDPAQVSLFCTGAIAPVSSLTILRPALRCSQHPGGVLPSPAHILP